MNLERVEKPSLACSPSTNPALIQDESYPANEEDEDDDELDRQTYSSGRTVATTVTSYMYENGRRYHVSSHHRSPS